MLEHGGPRWKGRLKLYILLNHLDHPESPASISAVGGGQGEGLSRYRTLALELPPFEGPPCTTVLMARRLSPARGLFSSPSISMGFSFGQVFLLLLFNPD